VDFTVLAKQICALVDQLTRQSKSATINQVVDILKGSKQKAIKDAGYDKLEQFNIAEDVTRISKWASFGRRLERFGGVWVSFGWALGECGWALGELWVDFGWCLSSVDLERLLSKLILDGYLHQDISINDTYGTASAYIRLGKETVFSTPVTLSVCVQKENENIDSTTSKNSSRDRLVDSCLSQLKDELKSISAEHNIKYSTILSEKALKQMALVMPKSKEEMLKKILEMTTIKYDMYKFDRLLSITCQFRAKSDEETDNSNLKRKRETPTTSSYFQDKTNQFVKKKK
jgi:superfamily II DNA helicase RecQ